jgi:hypothetical protein
MTILIVCVLVALAVLVVGQGLVLLELVRQMAQMRRELDLDDRPVPISLGERAGRPLPEPARSAWSENGSSRDGVLVFLSTDCATCRLVAHGLPELRARSEPRKILAVLQSRNHDELTEMLAAAGLTRDEVVVDLENDYGSALGVTLRPAAVVVRDGIVSEGATVRNAGQLKQLLETLESSALVEV